MCVFYNDVNKQEYLHLFFSMLYNLQQLKLSQANSSLLHTRNFDVNFVQLNLNYRNIMEFSFPVLCGILFTLEFYWWFEVYLNQWLKAPSKTTTTTKPKVVIYLCWPPITSLCLIIPSSMRHAIDRYSGGTTVQREMCVISVQFRAECPPEKPSAQWKWSSFLFSVSSKKFKTKRTDGPY